jgi:hypothetical protein
MRLINRMLLTIFLSDLENFTMYDSACNFSEILQFDQEQENNYWCDDVIDEEVKTVLSKLANGAYLPVDLISHFEFFYNTQSCGLNTENPFKNLAKYPALNYTNEDSRQTLYEKHRKLIFPHMTT